MRWVRAIIGASCVAALFLFFSISSHTEARDKLMWEECSHLALAFSVIEYNVPRILLQGIVEKRAIASCVSAKLKEKTVAYVLREWEPLVGAGYKKRGRRLFEELAPVAARNTYKLSYDVYAWDPYPGMKMELEFADLFTAKPSDKSKPSFALVHGLKILYRGKRSPITVVFVGRQGTSVTKEEIDETLNSFLGLTSF